MSLPSSAIEFKSVTTTEAGQRIIPSIIEPSFGISRILYALLEQNFAVRQDDEQRTVLTLPAAIAPIQACVLTLTQTPELDTLCEQVGTLPIEQQPPIESMGMGC